MIGIYTDVCTDLLVHVISKYLYDIDVQNLTLVNKHYRDVITDKDNLKQMKYNCLTLLRHYYEKRPWEVCTEYWMQYGMLNGHYIRFGGNGEVIYYAYYNNGIQTSGECINNYSSSYSSTHSDDY